MAADAAIIGGVGWGLQNLASGWFANESTEEGGQCALPEGSQGSAKDAQKKINKGQGPRDIDHIDSPNPDVPGSKWHAHGKGKRKGAVNTDGTIHDKHKGVPDLSGKSKKWLKNHGWK